MKTRLALVAAAAAVIPSLLIGCGGSDDNNSGERPSAADISGAFADQVPTDIPGADVLLECYGTELEASELPNGVLRSLVAGEEETSIDAENEEKYNQIVDDVIDECTSQVTESLTGS